MVLKELYIYFCILYKRINDLNYSQNAGKHSGIEGNILFCKIPIDKTATCAQGVSMESELMEGNMDKLKHTPGPCHVAVKGNYVHVVGPAVTGHAHGEVIARMVCGPGHNPIANGTLLAAAPDLLAALRDLAKKCDELSWAAPMHSATQENLAGMANDARAAIAKAEGR